MLAASRFKLRGDERDERRRERRERRRQPGEHATRTLPARAVSLSHTHSLAPLSLSFSLSPSPSLSPSLPVACSLQMLCWLRAVAFAAALHSEPWGVAQATPREARRHRLGRTAKAVYKSNRGCHHVPRRRHKNLIVAAATFAFAAARRHHHRRRRHIVAAAPPSPLGRAYL